MASDAVAAPTNRSRSLRRRGASLITVMLILVAVSLLGATSIGLATLGERSARNERDLQLAWQAAQAALEDAEVELSRGQASSRSEVFSRQGVFNFVEGCGREGVSKGLCRAALDAAPPWLTVDLGKDREVTAEFGQFTGKTFVASGTAQQATIKPRYVIEALPDAVLFADRDVRTAAPVLFRVTAIGFSPGSDSPAVLQALYRND